VVGRFIEPVGNGVQNRSESLDRQAGRQAGRQDEKTMASTIGPSLPRGLN